MARNRRDYRASQKRLSPCVLRPPFDDVARRQTPRNLGGLFAFPRFFFGYLHVCENCARDTWTAATALLYCSIPSNVIAVADLSRSARKGLCTVAARSLATMEILYVWTMYMEQVSS